MSLFTEPQALDLLAFDSKARQLTALKDILRQTANVQSDSPWPPVCLSLQAVRALVELLAIKGPQDPFGTRAISLIASIRAIVAYSTAPPPDTTLLEHFPSSALLEHLRRILVLALTFSGNWKMEEGDSATAALAHPDPRCSLVLLSLFDAYLTRMITVLPPAELPGLAVALFKGTLAPLSVLLLGSEDIELTEGCIEPILCGVLQAVPDASQFTAQCFEETAGEDKEGRRSALVVSLAAVATIAAKPIRPTAKLIEVIQTLLDLFAAAPASDVDSQRLLALQQIFRTFHNAVTVRRKHEVPAEVLQGTETVCKRAQDMGLMSS